MPLNVNEIIKMIEADGWYLIATRGSHGSTSTRSSQGGLP